MESFKFITKIGDYESAVSQSMLELEQNHIASRLWDHDYTVWRPSPTEITNRLGWLHLPETMQSEIAGIQTFVSEVRAEGYTHVLLLGMGGSSLAPELFAKTFDTDTGLTLSVLDSTDPGYVRHYVRTLPLAQTLFIVATKSGGTVETLSFFKYFYNLLSEQMEATAAGSHFVAITDPGSRLESLAQTYQFRATFLNDPNIGGRYSALSHFGLVPAALAGVDLAALLARAAAVAKTEAPLRLGAIMGVLANNGRDKLTIISSPLLASFGDWAEQLVAESTGKDGKGIVPIVGEPLGGPDRYGADRLFIYLHMADQLEALDEVRALEEAGQPVVGIVLNDVYDIGGQFMMWEIATAVAGHFLDIQPFDQPNVEAAKILGRDMVAAYLETGNLTPGEATPPSPGALQEFLSQAVAGDYVAIQAYITPNSETDAALRTLRTQIRDRYRLATTVGYGPRFLHSTGQLHKGDGGNGLFIQLIATAAEDVPIPDEAGAAASSMSFGVLLMAQALGDGQALLDNGRRLIRFDLGTEAASNLQTLIQ